MNRRRFVQSSLAAAVAASLPASEGLAAILSGSMGVDADINAVTGDGAEVTLKQAAVKELGESLRGNLVLPGNDITGGNLQRPLKMLKRFPAPTGTAQELGQFQVGVPVARVVGKGRPKLFLGERLLPIGDRDRAEVVVGLALGGIEADGLPKRFDGFSLIARVGKRNTEAKKSRSAGRVLFNRWP